MTTHTLKLSDGAHLHVKLLGPATAPLLIALHGGPGLDSHASSLQAYSFLSSRNFRVLVYDARGSGASDKRGPYSHARWVADLEELRFVLLRSLVGVSCSSTVCTARHTPANIFISRIWATAPTFLLSGASYGSCIALEYALTHPQRLSGLILRGAWACGVRMQMQALTNCLSCKRGGMGSVDPQLQFRLWSGTVDGDEEFLRGVGEVAALFGGPDSDEVGGQESRLEHEHEHEHAHELKSNVEVKAQQGAQHPDQTTEESGPAHAETHNAAFSTALPAFDVRARLEEIRIPTLITVGRHDLISPVAGSDEIARGIEGSKLVVFEKSGHNPAEDEMERWREVVGNWFAGLRLGAGP